MIYFSVFKNMFLALPLKNPKTNDIPALKTISSIHIMTSNAKSVPYTNGTNKYFNQLMTSETMIHTCPLKSVMKELS